MATFMRCDRCGAENDNINSAWFSHPDAGFNLCGLCAKTVIRELRAILLNGKGA